MNARQIVCRWRAVRGLGCRRRVRRWAVPCRDSAGRRRCLIIQPTEDDRLALIGPTGVVAVLDPLYAGRLVDAMRQAVHALDIQPNRQREFVVPIVRATA
jgi:hypothetical protein